MARKSGLDQILAMVDTHPALKALPMATRFLWLALARLMYGHGISVLRFGSAALCGREIALALAICETELEPNLQPLLARELLVREADGALACPMLARLISRSETNRINGLRGGRPRKERDANGQRSMLLPLAGGGAAAVCETEPKPTVRPQRGGAQLASYSESQIELARTCKSEAGIEGEPSADEVRIVAKWVGLGATEDLILDLIERKPRVAKGLYYFDKAMLERLGADQPAAPAVAAACDGSFEAWKADYEAWKLAGRPGEMPNLYDYRKAA